MDDTFPPENLKKTPAEIAALNGRTDVIPLGPYCHGARGSGVVCPYWDRDLSAPEQLDGYCHFLKAGDRPDRDDSTFLLWDQVKECGINLDEEHDLD